MRSLHEIGADLEEVEALLTNIDGEIPDGEIGAKIEAYFANLLDERDEKIRRICGLIEMLGLGADDCAEVIRRITRLKRANENGAERLKGRLKIFFEDHGIEKLNLGIFKPRIQPNGSARKLIYPEAWDEDAASAPEVFHKPVITLDTKALRETVEGFYARAEKATAAAKTDQEQRELFKAWIEADEEERATWELVKDCSIAPRGNHLRLR